MEIKNGQHYKSIFKIIPSQLEELDDNQLIEVSISKWNKT